MSKLSFVFTISFVLLGPMKLIPAFGAAVQGLEPKLRRRVAVIAASLAAATCLLLVAIGPSTIGKYQIGLPALQLAGGLVLLIAALRVIFPPAESAQAVAPVGSSQSPWRVAISPLVTPLIVSPAGVAALLIFVTSAPRYPGMYRALAIVLPIIIALDFLVMYFNERIVRLPGLMLGLKLFGEVMIFIQVALGADAIVHGIEMLGASPT